MLSTAIPKGRESRWQLRNRLMESVLDGTEIVPGTHATNSEVMRAAFVYLKVGRAFRTGGLPKALPLVPETTTHSLRNSRSDLAVMFAARAAAWKIQGIARTLGGAFLCLHESLGITAALRTIGFDAEVVIGYPIIEHSNGSDELHAWPALGDMPLIGRAGERPLAYVELTRYPEGAESCC